MEQNKPTSTSFNWDRLNEMVSNRTDKPPANAATSYDIAKKTGLNINTVITMLRGKVSAGTMKKDIFWDDSRKRRVSYYWFADGVEEKSVDKEPKGNKR